MVLSTLTISLISALAPLVSKGIGKLVGSETGGETDGEPLGDVSGHLVKTAFNRLVQNLPEIMSVPENHDLLRAVRRSYLNAANVMCFSRLQNINPSRFNAKNLLFQVLPGDKDANNIIKFLRDRLRSDDPETHEEIEWLFHTIGFLNNEIANVPHWKVTETFESATLNAELLLKPENAGAQIAEIEAKLKAFLISELARASDYRVFRSDDMAGVVVGPEGYAKCLPPEVRKSLEKGWVYIEPDRSVLQLAAKQIDFKWFDVMSVFFAEEIKNNPRVNNIFNAKILADLKYQNGRAFEYSTGDFAEQLGKSNEVILASLNEVKDALGDIDANIKLLLPLDVSIKSANITLQLLRQEMCTGFDESKARDQESKTLQETMLAMLSDIQQGQKESIPSQKVPPTTIYFPEQPIGREDIFSELQKAYDAGKRIFILQGMGGAGKSRICREFARRNREKYSTQIWIDMLGLSDHPLAPIDAMYQVVRLMDPDLNIGEPEGREESVVCGQYQNLIAQQPALLVFDNVDALSAVEPLCQVNDALIIITSRNDTPDELSTAVRIKVRQMSEADANSLLVSIAGEDKLNGKAGELAQMAGFLPMTLKVLASALKTSDYESVDELMEKYRDIQKLFQSKVPDYKHGNDIENLRVEASFELSYQKLSEELQLYWRWLSISPADFDIETMRHILGIKMREAEGLEVELRNRSLLEYNAETKRYKFHDLARAFAGSKFDEYISDGRKSKSVFKRSLISFLVWINPTNETAERLEASWRHANHYAGVFREAYELKHRGTENGFKKALELLDTEWNNIIAGQKWAAEHYELEKRFAQTCSDYSGFSEFFDLRLTQREAISWLEISIKATKLLGDTAREGRYIGNMGVHYRHLGNYAKAAECHTKSLEIAQRYGDEGGEASALGNLATVYASTGDPKKAIELLTPVLETARRTGNRSRESLTLDTLGSVYSGIGEYKKAIEMHTASLEIAREIGDLQRQAGALENLATDYYCLGDEDKTREYDQAALQIAKDIGDGSAQALLEHNMGGLEDAGSFEEFLTGIEKYKTALEKAQAEGNEIEQIRVLDRLSRTHLQMRDPMGAMQFLNEAVTIAQNIGDREKEMQSVGGIANILGMIGEPMAAIEGCEIALGIAREIGDKYSEGMNLYRIGMGHENLGDIEKARSFWREAHKILNAIGAPMAKNVERALMETGGL